MHDQTGKFTLYEVGKKNGTLPIPHSRTLEAFTHDADDMSQNELLDAMMTSTTTLLMLMMLETKLFNVPK